VTTLVVPPLDEEPWPTLGPAVCRLLEERAVFGPGSLKGQPYRLDPEKRALIYRAYEVYPQGHWLAGRRRFRRVGVSLRKGTAKTEWQALIAFAELHPEGPVRCDGFDAQGLPVGRPVRDPYIPMLAHTQEQVEELAYGALYAIITEGPDADLFDAGLDRIIRLGRLGRADGKAVPLAGSPSARDGARTTHQSFDETHRLHSPRHLEAFETMQANLGKRPLDDPWSLEVTTAGELGQGSVAENTHAEAEMIERGEVDDPELFYMHREAGPGHDMTTLEGRIEAIREATGPVGEYAPGQFRQIAKSWDRPKADRAYLERVYCNRWLSAARQAWDVARWPDLQVPDPIPRGALVAGGFDGARFRDATALVFTDLATGRQQLWGLWERPPSLRPETLWEVPEAEVTASLEQAMEWFQVWRVYADPPHWTETVGSWEARWPDRVHEWWTHRTRAMAEAVRAYDEAQKAGAVSFVADDRFGRHHAAAGRKDVNLYDDDGRRLFVLQKLHPDRKFDASMAGCLSWRCYLDGIKGKAEAAEETYVPRRIR
jgi:hypothetical protein